MAELFTTPPLPVVPQSLLRELVDIVWQNAKESTEVPATSHADELIARVFTSEPVSQPYKLPVVPDERAAFESFMSERFGDSIDIRRAKNGDNEYMAWDVAVAWIVWQQKVMLAAAPKPGVKRIKLPELFEDDRHAVTKAIRDAGGEVEIE